MTSRIVIVLASAVLLVQSMGAQGITEQYRSPAGIAYQSLPDTGAVEGAAAEFRRDPSVANAVALGTAQAGVRQFREAIETFSDALRRHPNDAVLLRWRGHRYLTLRDFSRARHDLERAAALDSTLYGAWYHLGVLDFAEAKFVAAVQAFSRALPLAPNAGERAGSVDWLWMSLMRARRPDAAQSLLNRRPDSLPAGNAYERRLQLYRGELTPASFFTASDTADVQVSTLAFGLGHWYRVEGDTARARALYERAIAAGGWPGFAFIVAERELAEWGSETSGDEVEHVGACVAGLAPAAGRRTSYLLRVTQHPIDTIPTAAIPLHAKIDSLLTRAASTHRRLVAGRPSGIGEADSLLSWRGTDGLIALTVHRDGRVVAAHSIEIGRDQPGRFDGVRQLAATVNQLVSSERIVLDWPAGLGGDSVVVYGLIISEASIGRVSGMPNPLIRVSAPLYSLVSPQFRPATPRPGVSGPRYPVGMARLGAEATVRLRYVVDSSGYVELGSIADEFLDPAQREPSLADPRYQELRRAIIEFLGSGRVFEPARIGTCKIRQTVVQPFVFHIQRPRSP